LRDVHFVAHAQGFADPGVANGRVFADQPRHGLFARGESKLKGYSRDYLGHHRVSVVFLGLCGARRADSNPSCSNVWQGQ
jgi:hypothetical protein